MGRVRARASAGGARRGAPGWCSRADGREVVQFDGPVLELMTASRTRFDQQLAALGPDVLAARVRPRALPAPPARGRPDARRSATRCSTSAPSRGSGRSGGPRAASPPRSTRGARPAGSATPRRWPSSTPSGRGWRAARRTDSTAATSRSTANRGSRAPAAAAACGRAGRARQPSDILVPGMPDMTPPARTLKRIGHKGADLIAPGNTIASFDAALAAGVDMIEFDVLPEHRDGSGRPRARPRLRGRRPRRRRSRSRRASPTSPGRVGRRRARTST